ncbi:hypothetical protein D3C81_1894040 [compost metagenome]
MDPCNKVTRRDSSHARARIAAAPALAKYPSRRLRRDPALFEHPIIVPTKRIGCSELTVVPLKIMQKAITLSIFVSPSVLHLFSNH